MDSGHVAADWAQALAPVESRIEAMGRFLREEMAAGRGYLPAGDHVLRAFQRPLAEVRVLVVGQDPYPTPGHPIGLSFAVAPDVRPVPRSLANIYTELGRDLGHRAGRPRRPHRVGRPGGHAAQPGPHRRPRPGRVAPGPRLGGGHRAGDPRAGRPRRAVRGDPVGPRRPVAQADAGADPVGRVGPPLARCRPRAASSGPGPFSRVDRLLEEQGGSPVDWRLPAGSRCRRRLSRVPGSP